MAASTAKAEQGINPETEGSANLEAASERATALINKLGFAVEITPEERGDRTVLNVSSAQHALLIGRGGETLQALQYIFNTMQKKAGEEFVTLDVAGYRKEREDQLVAIAEEAAGRARASKAKVHLKPMNAYERRQVHMVLADMPDIVTTSEGAEPNRVIMVQLRDEQ